MTAKTIMLAFAAAIGLAASAEVVQLKFTVKTAVDKESKGNKTQILSNKTISGLVDTETGRQVFWTTENRKNVVIPNAFFKVSNDATVAKKNGQNAELIWGSEEDPENVLVAGAWGSATSLSGQVAGMLDKIPATGTWTAKVDKKKSFDQLCTSNKVAGETASRDGVIDSIKKASSEDLAAKEAELAGKVAELEQAKSDVADAADKLNKVKAEYDQRLAEKQQEVDEHAATIDEIKKAVQDINDPELPNMFENYLDRAEADATALKELAQAKIDQVDLAFASYKETFDLAAMQADIDAAWAKSNECATALAKVTAERNALDYTNRMMTVSAANQVGPHFDALDAELQRQIDVVTNEIANLETSFPAYTNTMITVTIPELENAVVIAQDAYDVAVTNVDAKQVIFDMKENDYALLVGLLNAFVPPTVENGELLDYDAFIADPVCIANYGLNGLDVLGKMQKYDQYKLDKEAEKKAPLEDAVNRAREAAITAANELAAAEATKVTKGELLEVAKRNLTTKQGELDKAIATGKVPGLTEKEAELAELMAKKDAQAEERAYWKNFASSEADREKMAETLRAAEAQVTEKTQALEDAKDELEAAEEALAQVETTRALRLAALGTLIGTDLTGQGLPAIEQAVANYKAEYQAKVDDANKILTGVAGVREKLLGITAE